MNQNKNTFRNRIAWCISSPFSDICKKMRCLWMCWISLERGTVSIMEMYTQKTLMWIFYHQKNRKKVNKISKHVEYHYSWQWNLNSMNQLIILRATFSRLQLSLDLVSVTLTLCMQRFNIANASARNFHVEYYISNRNKKKLERLYIKERMILKSQNFSHLSIKTKKLTKKDKIQLH